MHAQSQRFLSPEWTGLDASEPEPALRPLVEALAFGGKEISDFIVDPSPNAASLLKWLSAFRLAARLACQS